MRKNVIPLILITVAFSCTNMHRDPDSNDGVSKTKEAQKKPESDRVELAKKWLIHSIEDFFENYIRLRGDYSKICTKQYAEFKQDATNVDMDGGMTEEAFKNKWGRRYSEYAGIQEGFLVAGTDFGTIRVTRCEFRNKTEMGGFLYETILEDTEFKSQFKRDIVVMPSGRSFLIDNVYEKENVFVNN